MDSSFWQRDPDVVAKALLGRTIVVGTRSAVVLETEGYPRSSNTGVYKPILEMGPGEVYCPRKWNSLFLLIVTSDGGEGGGCVLIRSAEIENVLCDGPGKVTSHLHLGEESVRARGTTSWLNRSTLRITLSTPEFSAATPSPSVEPLVRGNGGEITEALIETLMPKIVDAYMAGHRGEGFARYLNTLLSKCGNVRELRELLEE